MRAVVLRAAVDSGDDAGVLLAAEQVAQRLEHRAQKQHQRHQQLLQPQQQRADLGE
jgi:hypothetical protein